MVVDCEQKQEEKMEVSEMGEGKERDGLQKEEAESKERRALPWLSGILQGTLCHLFQRLALEGDKSNMDLTQQVNMYSRTHSIWCRKLDCKEEPIHVCLI